MTKMKKEKDWVPKPLLRFNLWQGTFMTEIQDPVIAPQTGIPTGTGSKMATLLGLQGAYLSAYSAAPPHSGADKLLIKARNDASKAFKKDIRAITSQYLRHNDNLSDLQKGQIGIIPLPPGGISPHTTHTEIVERTEPLFPDVKVKSNTPGTVTFTYAHGVPANMHHLLVQYIVQAPAAPAPATPDDCNKHLEIQKSPYTKDLSMANSGNKLLGFAAWVDTRGVIHNWSPIFSCIIT